MDREQKKEIVVQEQKDMPPAFSNGVNITVADDAVFLQFLYLRPNTDSAKLVGEIVLTPKHAITFQKLLEETIKKHFTRHLTS